jgi:hyperosmotically inducible protein
MQTARNRHAALMIAVLVLMPLMLACGRGARLNDATLTTRVKTAILNDPTVGKLPIDVDTVDGVVTLSGRVMTEAQRDHAVALARSVSGVVDVKHTLEIVPKAHNRSPMPSTVADAGPGAMWAPQSA